MKRQTDFDYPGVGRIWKRDDGWYWETVYGDRGGPGREKQTVLSSMECRWRTIARERSGINMQNSGAKYSMPNDEKLDKRSPLYDENLVLTWKQARVLICRAWG